MGAKAVVRDVGRVLGMPYGKVDELAKLIPAPPGQDVTLELAKEMEPDFKKKIDGDEQYQELMRYAEPLEGITRNLGMHAGGVLIAPGPLTNFCPLYSQDGQPENTISQFDKHDVENVGLVKFDFLGLTTLTILNKCVEYINKLHPGQSFELRRIPTDDPATLKLFQDGDTTAVFQFESPGMRQLLRQAHPDRIEDLVALNALYRPGPDGNDSDLPRPKVRQGTRHLPRRPHGLSARGNVRHHGVSGTGDAGRSGDRRLHARRR